MKIKRIQARNFRLLEKTTLNLTEDISWLIGKNNTGKTSFLVLFDRFYNLRGFDFNDFCKKLRTKILSIDSETDVSEISIKLLLEIEYNDDDNLSNISEFITDLESTSHIVKIAFEAVINKEALLKDIAGKEEKEKQKYIKNNIGSYIKQEMNIYNDEDDLKTENRYKLIRTDIKFIKNMINFQFINAKREVSSSDDKNTGKMILSTLTTKFFNSQNVIDPESVKDINGKIEDLDKDLDTIYEKFFEKFLKDANSFLNMNNIRVESNLESKSIVSNSSKVVYGAREDSLPEYLNGLGYMNILYLLLNIEISKKDFEKDKKDINLLYIEEPEAHTHPQMQYVFAREIDNILKDIPNLQTVITTHSPHMISQCDFKKLAYFKNNDNGIDIINFENEMQKLYENEESLYKFVKEYLTIESSELFFANKVIFIEGISERMLIHYFMKKHDDEIKKKIEEKNKLINSENGASNEVLKKSKKLLESELLLSQNITILEVGANAKAFKKFIEFLGIKCLIITDIDSIDSNEKSTSVINGVYTSNATIKDFLNGYKSSLNTDTKVWFKELVDNPEKMQNVNKNLRVAYQVLENDYNPRSFEDAFINANIGLVLKKKDDLDGLKNKENITEENIYHNKLENKFYDFIYGKRNKDSKLIKGLNGIIYQDKKSNFASSIAYLALAEDVDWTVPKYIKEGLEWIAK